MSTDLFFLQLAPKAPAADSQCDKIGSSALNQRSMNHSTPGSVKGDDASFLKTLKQASRERASNGRSEVAGDEPLPDSNPPAAIAESDASSDCMIEPADMIGQQGQNSGPDQTVPDWKFMALIKVLENMGFHDAIGGADLQHMIEGNQADGETGAAVKMLVSRLQQNKIIPSVDLKAGLAKLQQFMARAAASLDRNMDQTTDLAKINQWLKSFTSGIKDHASIPGPLAKTNPQTAGLEIPASTGGMTAAGEGSVERLSGQGSPAGNSGFAPSPESTDAGLLPKSRMKPETHDPGNRQEPKTIQRSGSADSGDVKTGRPADPVRNSQPAGQNASPSLKSETADREQQIGTDKSPGARYLKTESSSAPNSSQLKESEGHYQKAPGEESSARVYQTNSQIKEGAFRLESNPNGERSHNITKIESGSNDSGLPNSTPQHAEKSTDAAASLKESGSGQSTFRNQTMDQIVQKAAIHLRNGQHEARIDLKPDFLGHVRMQVVSDNQLVTVRILAEHGFVKDMIESNVHQLKADLQQQGLEVEKVEVTVSRDPEDSGSSKEKYAQSRARQRSGSQSDSGQPENEQKKDNRQSPKTINDGTTVDYFA